MRRPSFLSLIYNLLATPWSPVLIMWPFDVKKSVTGLPRDIEKINNIIVYCDLDFKKRLYDVSMCILAYKCWTIAQAKKKICSKIVRIRLHMLCGVTMVLFFNFNPEMTNQNIAYSKQSIAQGYQGARTTQCS